MESVTVTSFPPIVPVSVLEPTPWLAGPATFTSWPLAPTIAGSGMLSVLDVLTAAASLQPRALQTAMTADGSAPVVIATAPPALRDPTATTSSSAAVSGFARAASRTTRRVAGAGVATTRRVVREVWAGIRNPRLVHVSQVPSRYNSSPAEGNRDCGPVSVVMALRLLGRAIPGVRAGASPQQQVNRVRALSGNVDNTVPTSNHELERALAAAGATTSELSDFASIRESVLSGRPVILNGNPRNPRSYGPAFSSAQMAPYDGSHWIVVSGYDPATRKFIINDPLSKVGPVKISPTQLEAYRGGSLGIVVS